jgi:hypothetical protein
MLGGVSNHWTPRARESLGLFYGGTRINRMDLERSCTEQKQNFALIPARQHSPMLISPIRAARCL